MSSIQALLTAAEMLEAAQPQPKVLHPPCKRPLIQLDEIVEFNHQQKVVVLPQQQQPTNINLLSLHTTTTPNNNNNNIDVSDTMLIAPPECKRQRQKSNDSTASSTTSLASSQSSGGTRSRRGSVSRTVHNELEKTRRAQLRTRLDHLSEFLPSTGEPSARVTTLGLLTRAKHYIQSLRAHHDQLRAKKERLLEQQHLLQRHLQLLNASNTPTTPPQQQQQQQQHGSNNNHEQVTIVRPERCESVESVSTISAVDPQDVADLKSLEAHDGATSAIIDNMPNNNNNNNNVALCLTNNINNNVANNSPTQQQQQSRISQYPRLSPTELDVGGLVPVQPRICVGADQDSNQVPVHDKDSLTSRCRYPAAWLVPVAAFTPC